MGSFGRVILRAARNKSHTDPSLDWFGSASVSQRGHIGPHTTLLIAVSSRILRATVGSYVKNLY